MKRFSLSLGQTLILLVILALITVQQLHKRPLVDEVLDNLYPFKTGTSAAISRIADVAHLPTWSTSSPAFVTPAPSQPIPHHFDDTAQLTSAPKSEPATSEIQQVEDADILVSMPNAEDTISQTLRIDCTGRQTDHDLFQKAEEAVVSVMNASAGNLPRLECPLLDERRYANLSQSSGGKSRYFFAMNLHQSAHIIPQLLGAIVDAVKILGPDLCIISIVEGRSTDGTFEMLRSLLKELEHLGASYFLTCSDLQPGGEGMERISTLAKLRNTALQPLISQPEHFDSSGTVIFVNDIAPCAEDLLELILQRALLQADMTCGMDWYNLDDGEGGTFYDSWIGRQMNGEPFFEVPQSTSWDFSKNLFWNHPTSKMRYSLGLPLQIFSCWNGAAAISAKPFMDGKLRFRTQIEGECHLGEPVHLAKDLWKLGFGKIALIPSVNVGYSVEDSKRAKEAHGWASVMASDGSTELHLIDWQAKPPGQIKCLEEVFHNQWWEPFDLN